jgi:hypothetical protein
MSRKKKADQEPTMPFGKHKGKTLAAVLQEEPSYLCWFMETVEGCGDVKKAIAGLPGFREEWEKYFQRRHRKELTTRQVVDETVRRMFAVEEPTSPETLDSLCDRLFNAPPEAS